MTSEELLSHAALHSWKQVLERFNKGLTSLGEDGFQKRVAPGRNRLYYLLGHLTAVHDRMLPLLGIGDRLHSELDETFISNPDGKVSDPVSVAELLQAWSEVNSRLTSAFERYSTEGWLDKHTAVSDEDFAADPTRNRLAVVLNRTNHLSFHAGQFVLVNRD